MLVSLGGVDSLEAGSRAPLVQHFKVRHFHLQPVFHRPSGSYPIRPGSPVVGDKRNINVPSSQSSMPGRITFKPHHSHLCYRATSSLYLPCTLHTFPNFWNWAYHTLSLLYKTYSENLWRAEPRTWCSKRSSSLRGFFQCDSVHMLYLNGLRAARTCLHTPSCCLISGQRNECCYAWKATLHELKS